MCTTSASSQRGVAIARPISRELDHRARNGQGLDARVLAQRHSARQSGGGRLPDAAAGAASTTIQAAETALTRPWMTTSAKCSDAIGATKPSSKERQAGSAERHSLRAPEGAQPIEAAPAPPLDAGDDTPWRTATSDSKAGNGSSSPQQQELADAVARQTDSTHAGAHGSGCISSNTIDAHAPAAAHVPTAVGQPLFGRKMVARSLTDAEFQAAVRAQLPQDTTASSGEPDIVTLNSSSEERAQHRNAARVGRSHAGYLHATAGSFPDQWPVASSGVDTAAPASMPHEGDAAGRRRRMRRHRRSHAGSEAAATEGRFQAVVEQMHDDYAAAGQARPAAHVAPRAMRVPVVARGTGSPRHFAAIVGAGDTDCSGISYVLQQHSFLQSTQPSQPLEQSAALQRREHRRLQQQQESAANSDADQLAPARLFDRAGAPSREQMRNARDSMLTAQRRDEVLSRCAAAGAWHKPAWRASNAFGIWQLTVPP